MVKETDAIATDICVIGGGPAGSTVARQLAKLGYEVCIVDSRSSPRSHIVASLPPAIMPLLEFLGAGELIGTAGFQRQEKSIVWWSENEPREQKRDPGSHGLIVERGKFDRLLLCHAKDSGVSVFQPALASTPTRINGQGWKIGLKHEGPVKEVRSRFVVDASGGQKCLPGRSIRPSAPLMALYAYWIGEGSSETTSFVEAGPNEWLWYSPLGRQKAVAAVFIDPKRLSGTAPGDVELLYRGLLNNFRLFPSGRFTIDTGGVRACDASSRYSEVPVGHDFIRVGDSFFSLDPLSSQGIQSAIASGLQAAVVVNTLLRSPGDAASAIEFYRTRQQEKVHQHAIKTAGFYRERALVSGTPFWIDRAGDEIVPKSSVFEEESISAGYRIRLSEQAEIISLPVMKEDLIVSAPALRHPLLDRPVAFVGGTEIIPLLKRVRSGQTIGSLIKDWSSSILPSLSFEIVNWLWQRKILVRRSTSNNILRK